MDKPKKKKKHPKNFHKAKFDLRKGDLHQKICTCSDRDGACLSEKFRASRKLHSDEVLCERRPFFRPLWVDLVFTSRILLPANMSTTINTFHSSFNPPPVPPRSGHRGGPALPSNTPLVKFLSVLLLLLMIQTFGGFLYLFHRINMVRIHTLNHCEFVSVIKYKSHYSHFKKLYILLYIFIESFRNIQK